MIQKNTYFKSINYDLSKNLNNDYQHLILYHFAK